MVPLTAMLCRDCLQSAYNLKTTLAGIIGYCERCGRMADCAEIPVSLLLQHKQQIKEEQQMSHEEAERRIKELERRLVEANDTIRRMACEESKATAEKRRFNVFRSGKSLVNNAINTTLDMGDILLRTGGEILSALCRGGKQIANRVRGR